MQIDKLQVYITIGIIWVVLAVVVVATLLLMGITVIVLAKGVGAGLALTLFLILTPFIAWITRKMDKELGEKEVNAGE